MLVVDASVAVQAAHAGRDLTLLGDPDLVAPSLLWPEYRAAVRRAAWRGEISVERSLELVDALDALAVAARNPRRLGREALRVAEELGWAKTYDAEYVALALILDCRMVTLDGRLRRGADRLNVVVTPAEL